MTLQILQYFIVVARCKNFTRAATECYISQPALSRAMNDLERELGCQLIERTTRTFTLTPAGEVCLKEAEKVMAQLERLKTAVSAAGRKQKEYLRVGYITPNYLLAFNKLLSQQRENFQLESEHGTLRHIEEMLVRGSLDAILIPEMNRTDIPALEYGDILKSHLYALVHKSHPLSGRESVSAQELQDEKFIAWDESVMPGINQIHRQFCEKSGFTPHYVGRGKKYADVMVLVENNMAVALFAKGLAENLHPDFRALLIQDSEERYGIICAWMPKNRSPAIDRLEKMLKA